jgi:predicted transcriptional regulator
MIKLKDSKGVVILWAGLEEGEAELAAMKEDIGSFVEQDTLIVKDYVEKWRILNLATEDNHDPNIQLQQKIMGVLSMPKPGGYQKRDQSKVERVTPEFVKQMEQNPPRSG